MPARLLPPRNAAKPRMRQLALVLLAGASIFIASPAWAQLLTLDLLNDALLDLQADLGGLAADVTVLGGQSAQNMQDIADLGVQVGDHAGAIAGNSTAVANISAGLGAVQTDVTLLGDRTAAVEGGLVSVSADVDVLGDRIDQHDIQISNISVQVNNNSTAITNIDGRVTANATAVTNLDVRLSQTAADLASLDITVTDQGERVTALETGRAGLVRQADAQAPITVAAESGGSVVSVAGMVGDRRIGGVAAGIAANDAATVGQVDASAASTLASANSYTDRSAAATLADARSYADSLVAKQGRALRRDMDSVGAGSAALAGLPQSIIPGKGMIGAGIGGRGEAMAVALGLSKAFRAPHTPVVKAGAAIDARRGDVTYNAAVGFHF